MDAAKWMRATLIGAMASMVAACASIGRPEGGPKDVTPPEYVKSTPAQGEVNVDRTRLDIVFDENISLENISSKLVVSPAQKQMPSVSSNGKHITINLRDTLQPNTTYTFDFSDAIRDLNEGNILDGFALDFATGESIDTLRVSGMVLQARNLEPAQGMVVGVYSNLADSAVKTLPMERVAKTNQYGQFTIRGLKPGTYNIFALNDRNSDWHWDRSEDVAFSNFTVSPKVEAVEVADTLRSTAGEDSIVVRTGWHYTPDAVFLTWFNQNYRAQYLRDYERTDRRRATFKFGDVQDSLPDIRVINGPRAGRRLRDMSVIEAREGLDSIVYWFSDSMLVKQDSLLVEARYHRTDSLDQLSLTTDTLKLYVKGLRQEKKEKKKHDEAADTVPPQVHLMQFSAVTRSSQELNEPLIFEASEPVARIDTLALRLEMAVDSLWRPVKGWQLLPDSTNVRRYRVDVTWAENAKYRFTADSLSIENIYGEWITNFKHEFTTKKIEDYGNITFNFSDWQANDSTQLVVELLSKADAVVKALPVHGDNVTFTYVAPGEYYARAFIDVNRNGEWDTGNLEQKLQPEDVFYFEKVLKLRKNWDIDQEWSLYNLAVDMQKPNDIKKNKPKTRDKDKQNGSKPTDEDEDDEYGDDNMWGNGSQYNNARRGSTGNTGGLRSNRDQM